MPSYPHHRHLLLHAYAGCHHWVSGATRCFVTEFFLYSSDFRGVFLIFTDGKFLSATLILQTTLTKPRRAKPQQKSLSNMHLIHKEGAKNRHQPHGTSAFIWPEHEGIETKLMAHICGTHLQNKYLVVFHFMVISLLGGQGWGRQEALLHIPHWSLLFHPCWTGCWEEGGIFPGAAI